MPLFGVEELYACQRSLDERGLAASQLGLPVNILNDEALRALLGRFDQVMTI